MNENFNSLKDEQVGKLSSPVFVLPSSSPLSLSASRAPSPCLCLTTFFYMKYRYRARENVPRSWSRSNSSGKGEVRRERGRESRKFYALLNISSISRSLTPECSKAFEAQRRVYTCGFACVNEMDIHCCLHSCYRAFFIYMYTFTYIHFRARSLYSSPELAPLSRVFHCFSTRAKKF